MCRTYLEYLDLSRNRLIGKIPRCLENLQKLNALILSSNRLSSVIPSFISLYRLHLNGNNFTGELPREIMNFQSLAVLDLGDNNFDGNIPEWIGEKLNPMVLRLHRNNFSGRIPRSFCRLSNLQILDVAHNSLTGTIPPCLGQLSGMANRNPNWRLISPDSDENVIQVMKGVDVEYTRTWDLVLNMDLSSNKLVGEIPVELTRLSMLMGLNLSNNLLSGGIPNNIGNMTKLESVDFSRNELTGMIPSSMEALTFLSHLNLSHNHLSGRIPTGHQLQPLADPSIYVGNKDLCGPPLPNNCSYYEDYTTSKKSYEEGEEPKKVWFYVDIMSGFVTGFWGIIGVLLFKKQWRRKLFMFAEETIDKIYIGVVVRVAMMKRGREAP
ncbi:unnamed protein product [Lactuca saligna]|uniref:Leucine-rich repeat-containing N-terminal plant-type domain-containing protein n=1 Tax=Lactuca saligna TaxID=75948 RepID=A0AA36EKZ7_LACSI|nr:unnamed protein product [Lactuca saligna]